MRVLITDDHPVIRKGVRHILEEASAELGPISTDEAGSGAEAIEKVLKNDYDLVLLDISMPGMSGIEALKQLKAHRPKLPVLILSIYPEDQYAIRALRARASGYLTKESVPDELLMAIRKIVRGEKYISITMAERLICELDTSFEKPPHKSLSDRELQVMLKLASGKTVKEVAEELNLSVKTVSTYRVRIMRKMNMKRNIEMMQYALAEQLLPK